MEKRALKLAPSILADAGANVLVAGSTIFSGDEGLVAARKHLQAAVE